LKEFDRIKNLFLRDGGKVCQLFKLFKEKVLWETREGKAENTE